jgi:phosphoglycerate dehydrogenase-like enzyme
VRVLFCREQISAELPWAGLGSVLPGWEIAACPPDRVAESLDGADVVCPVGARLDSAAMEAGGFGLVQQFGVGLDRVDVAAATRLGIWVARVPGDAGGNADSVAELAVLHLLALARRLDELRAALAEQNWAGRPAGDSLLGATVVIVGLGAIGSAVARRLAPFGGTLLGVRARPQLGGPPGIAEVSGPEGLRGLLGRADAVVCCAELHAGTAGMFGPAEFGAMKPGALFVNVARGGLVDEDALLAAVESGQVGGAGLDVYAREPADPQAALLRHPRVLATPHAGFLTRVMFRETGALFAANLTRWASGEQPRWAVNAPPFCRRVPAGRP